MAGDYQDYIRNIGIYPMWGIFCDFTFQGHGAMWTTEKGDVHNKNEVSTRAIATSMGFRESRPSNGVFFPVGSPIFFVNGSLIFFGTYGCFRCGKKEHPLISLGRSGAWDFPSPWLCCCDCPSRRVFGTCGWEVRPQLPLIHVTF